MNWLNALIYKDFASPYERGGPVLVSIGVLSALLYVYTTTWLGGKLHNLIENVMVLTFIVSALRYRHQLKSDLIFVLFILSIVIPLLLFGINSLIDYEMADKYKSLNDLAKLFYFLPLAWWLGGSWVAVRSTLIVAFLGLITAILLDPDLIQNLNRLWAGDRVDFNIHNAQHAALFFSLTFLFSIITLSQLKKGNVTYWVLTALIIICLIGLIGLIGTKGRAPYLGLLACSLIAISLGFIKRRKPGSDKRSYVSTLLPLILFIGLMAGFVNEVQNGRFSGKSEQIHAFLTGDLERIPFSSIGVRVHSWAESLEWIAQRPITGWGRKANEDVIRNAEHFPDWVRTRFGHLHNGYLEMLLGYGIVGLSFLVILYVALLRRIRSAANPHLYAFAFYGTVFFLVLNMFESMFFYRSGEFAMALIFAGGYSQYLARSLGGSEENDSFAIEKAA